MAPVVNERDILIAERQNAGTAWTKNDFFEKNGYLVIKDLWDADELYHPVPEVRGQYTWWGDKADQYSHIETEQQVEGSLARYWHPQYRYIHTGVRLKLEEALGRKLYNTYYYDRFYFPGQELHKHCDRPACEISVTVHISTTLSEPWPIWIKTPDTYVDKQKSAVLGPGQNSSVILNAGDGMVYKGCERPHWREPMPREYETKWFRKVEKEGLYYHQIFFHYVLQDGQRTFAAFDMGR